MSDLKLTVYLSTYNQEKYIAEALDSILMQKTDFDFEIIAADDCSTDKTQQIILDYQKKYPDKIVTYFTEVNVGGCQKLVDCIEKGYFKGEYLAYLEGDDYWLDENRLQILVSFLDENKKYSRVSHKRHIINEKGEVIGFDISQDVIGKDFTICDFLDGRQYSDFGSVFRNYYKDNKKKYSSLFLSSRNVCDFQSMFITQEYGPVYIMDKCLGVYRLISSEGASNYNSITTSESRAIENIKLANAVEKFYNDKYDLTCMKNRALKRIFSISVQNKDKQLFTDAKSMEGLDYISVLSEIMYLYVRQKQKKNIAFIKSMLNTAENRKIKKCFFRYSVKRIMLKLSGKRENELLRGKIREN